MERQSLSAICISIYGRCEAERACWSWIAVDGDEQSLAEEDGVAELHREAGAIEAYALATRSALQWVKEQALQDVVLCIGNAEFVGFLTCETIPTPYVAVQIAPLIPLLEEVGGSVDLVEA